MVAAVALISSIATTAQSKGPTALVSSDEFFSAFVQNCVSNLQNLKGLFVALRKTPGFKRVGDATVANAALSYFILPDNGGNALCALRAEISDDPKKLDELLWKFARNKDRAAARSGSEFIKLELFGAPATFTFKAGRKDRVVVVMVDQYIGK